MNQCMHTLLHPNSSSPVAGSRAEALAGSSSLQRCTSRLEQHHGCFVQGVSHVKCKRQRLLQTEAGT